MKKVLFRLASAAAALCFGVSLWAESITVNVNSASGTTYRGNGSTYSVNTTATAWVAKWESTTKVTVDGAQAPALTLLGQSAYTNNLRFPDASKIDIMEGGATKAYTYTLTAARGYVIKSVSITGVVTTQTNPTSVALGANAPVAMTAAEQTLSVTGNNSQSVTLALTSTNNNGGFQSRNFQVVLEEKPEYIISTEGNVHWYYIVSQATSAAYALGKAMYYDADANLMKFGTKTYAPNYIWSIWKDPNSDKLELRAYDGTVMGTPGNGTGGDTQFGKATTDHNYVYTIAKPYTDQYTLMAGTGQPLHAQNAGSVLVRWEAQQGNASVWTFEPVDVSNASTRLNATNVQQGKVTTGRGNQNDPIIRSTLSVTGLTGALSFSQVKGRINATNKADIKAVKAYLANNSRELWVGASNTGENAKDMAWRPSNVKTYLGQGTVDSEGNYTITFTTPQNLAVGNHYLWITFDIAEEAAEGNTVDATITEYTINGQPQAEANGNPTHAATIFLSEGSVLLPFDNGSAFYRIPAITATKDGRRLVTLTDDRINHGGDLPNHCYLVAQYSDDNGKTWSQPKRVAGEANTGGNYGHGDAQIILNRNNGEIYGIMTSSPTGYAFNNSAPADQPARWKVMKSMDNGESWTVPVDHTNSLYGANAVVPAGAPEGAKVITNSGASFSGSGAGLQMRDGTLVSPFSIREKENGSTTYNAIRYYNVMSKDNGQTWFLYGTPAPLPADEPKILERDNGDLAISVRTSGFNYHNVTSDLGKTWNLGPNNRFNTGFNGNACDGEYMVWCSRLEGNPWTIVAQTMPNNGSRQNVSIALSTDQGATFGTPKTVCPRGSAYSAVTVLGDGTMGMYYEEEGVTSGYTMRFVRFSLDWASNRQYKFTEANPYRPIQPLTEEVKQNAQEVKSLVESFGTLPEEADITLTEANFSSPHTETREGSIAALIDNNATTFWHSKWSGGNVDNGVHYLQVEVPEGVADNAILRFWFKRRAVDNDHITEWRVVGTYDQNAQLSECAELAASILTPYRSNTEEVLSDPFPRNGFKYIRFVEKATTSNRGYFHLAEFKLKTSSEKALELSKINQKLNEAGQSGNYAVTNEVKEQVINLLPTLSLNESSASVLPADKRVNVSVQRTLNADGWNTLCLPFNMSEAEVKATFGEDATLMEYTACNNDLVLQFTKTQTIEAGKPYFLKLTSAINDFSLRNIEIKNTEQPVEYNSIAFKGTLNPTSLTQALHQFYFNKEGQLVKPITEGANIKGMRAFIQAPDAESGARLTTNFDGVATAIDRIDGQSIGEEAVYNLQGQRVNRNALTRGLYIQKGHKYIVK
ncbi:MAG: exo-alpha-sialidase [Prevotellaceae bacterium]|nr:exo-alpha-sialidase [Prevotellaceae bacterium]